MGQRSKGTSFSTKGTLTYMCRILHFFNYLSQTFYFVFRLLLETICATEPTSRGVEPHREVKTLLMVAYFAYL